MSKKLAIFCLLAVLLSCRPASKEPIRIGLDIWPGYALAYLAEEKGFFRDEGLDVELVEFSSPLDSRTALEKGAVDISLTTMIDALILASRGVRLTVPFLIDFSYGGDGIVARNGITSLNELKGKRVALEHSSLGLFTLTKALEKSWVGIEELELVDVSPPEAEEMFGMGLLDACVTSEPFLSRMSKEGELLFTSREVPWEIVDVICFRKDVVEKNPQVLQAVLKTWLRAISYWKKHPAEASAVMAEGMNVKLEEFSIGIQGANILELRLNLAAFGMPNMPGPVYESSKAVSKTLYSIGMVNEPIAPQLILDREPILTLLSKGTLWTESLER